MKLANKNLSKATASQKEISGEAVVRSVLDLPRGFEKIARPHPCPLPQERVNVIPLLDERQAMDLPLSLHVTGKGTGNTKVAQSFSETSATLSLSLGERVGVRAGVSPTNQFPKKLGPSSRMLSNGEFSQEISHAYTSPEKLTAVPHCDKVGNANLPLPFVVAGKKTGNTKVAQSFPETSTTPSLSLEERVGVRASVPLTNNNFAERPHSLFGSFIDGTRVIRQGVRCTGLQRIENCISNTLAISAQLGIPESQFQDSLRAKKCRTFNVVRPLVRVPVARSVQFNGETSFLAEEIEDVVSNGMLSAKFITGETTVAQPAPHKFFRPSRTFSQCARAIGSGHTESLSKDGRGRKFRMFAHPHPCPLPQERVNGMPLLDEKQAMDLPLSTNAVDKKTGITKATKSFSETSATLPLSSGERVGVRASVVSSKQSVSTATNFHSFRKGRASCSPNNPASLAHNFPGRECGGI